MNEYTPGPWNAKYANDGCGDIGIVGDGGVVAECFHEIREKNERANRECIANARLIAAAPDLLEALKAARDELDEYRVDTNSMPSTLEIIDAAITKATGEPA